MCGNYSREETIQGRKLYEEIRYIHMPGNHQVYVVIQKWVDMETSIAVDIETSISGGQNSKCQPGLFNL